MMASISFVLLQSIPMAIEANLRTSFTNTKDRSFWGFVAPLLTSPDLGALWRFANEDPERGILEHALQSEADKRGVTLVRVAQQRQLETTAV
jgi:hypothetical protein